MMGFLDIFNARIFYGNKVYVTGWLFHFALFGEMIHFIFQVGWFNHQLGSYQVILEEHQEPQTQINSQSVKGHHVSHTMGRFYIYLHVHPWQQTNVSPLKSDHFSREYIDSNHLGLS